MKIFSKINLVLFVLIVLFVFVFYQRFLRPESQADNRDLLVGQEEKKDFSGGRENLPKEKEQNNDSLDGYKSVRDKNLVGQEIKTEDIDLEKKDAESVGLNNGLYTNEKYRYKIVCPPDWPVRERSNENVSIGYIPPVSGQGNLTIQAVDSVKEDLEKMKKEAEQYPGLMNLTEEEVFISGKNATKITIKSSVSKTSIYFLMETNSKDFVIKYVEESPEFSGLAEKAVKTFNFF